MRDRYWTTFPMLCAGMFLLMIGALIYRPETKQAEKRTEATPVVSTDTGSDPESEADITFEEILRGEAFPVTDEELREWIRENRGSEESWLVAHSLRSSSGMNDWLAAALMAHPDSRPLVLSAAGGELWPLYSGESESRVWIDRLLAIDPSNGVAWFLSAIAHYYRGDFDIGDEHWVRASRQSEIRLYAARFEESSFAFGRAKGYPESMASLLSDTAAPVLLFPKLTDVIKEVQLRADALREVGREAEAVRLEKAGYQLGNLFFERDISDDHRALSPIIGVQFNKTFKDRVPIESVLENFETQKRMDAFVRKWNDYRQEKKRNPKMNETTYQAWHDFRRHFGETEALELLPRKR